jgi:hypothetical protein
LEVFCLLCQFLHFVKTLYSCFRFILCLLLDLSFKFSLLSPPKQSTVTHIGRSDTSRQLLHTLTCQKVKASVISFHTRTSSLSIESKWKSQNELHRLCRINFDPPVQEQILDIWHILNDNSEVLHYLLFVRRTSIEHLCNIRVVQHLLSKSVGNELRVYNLNQVNTKS